MNREEYLNQNMVNDFVCWGSNYLFQWRKCHSVKRSSRSPAFLFDIQGIEQAYEKYKWRADWSHPKSEELIKSDDAESTEQSLLKLANGLAESINNPELHAKLCCSVLNWGGVPNSKNFYTKDAQNTVDYHRQCHCDPGIFIPERADDNDCTNNRNMSSGITKVHALLSISPIAHEGSSGLVIYDARVAAAFNDLVAQYCIAKKMVNVPRNILFCCGSARGSQRRKPNRVPGQQYPTLSTQSPGNWTRDAMRVSWLLDAMLQHENSELVFQGLPIRERFLRAQMGLFMIGYDLNDCANNDNETIESSDDDLTIEPRSLRTLGKGNIAQEYTYKGSVVEGVDIMMGKGTPATFPPDLFSNLLAHFSDKVVPGGFKIDNPPQGGVGKWVNDSYSSFTPRHASFIATILVNEGYCSHFHKGNAVMLRFPPV